MLRMERERTLVVGTAGHIDHGKSRLVHALTGTDPDRLPEEKARGLTIDLGFAHAAFGDARVSFVDVPGHERFIRNMVAGATGVDVALLVVAADDSVMPQTREHAEVLSLLGLRRCIVALTKMDLVDDEWGDAVADEVAALLDELGLTPTALVRTSAESGRGLDELRELLTRTALEDCEPPLPYTWFRMPVDRSFVVAGRGTVVTGTVSHGRVQRDAELVVWPAQTAVRARGLQTHNDRLDAVAGRLRLAVNLAGVSHDEIQRGCTLATPGYLEPARYLDAYVPWLRMPGKTRRQTLRLRLHIGTRDVLCEVRLRDKPTDDPVRDQYVQLKAAEPVVATWGERFILRDESGTRTLGGGRVLRPVARLWTARRPAHVAGLDVLHSGPPPARLEEAIRALEWRPVDEQRLATLAGLADEDDVGNTCRRLMGGGRVRVLEVAGVKLYVHNAHLEVLGEDLTRRLKAYLADNPRQAGLPRSEWPGWMPGACPARLRPALADWFLSSGRFALEHDHVVPAGEKKALPPADQQLLDAILAEFDAGAFQPPREAELQCRTPQNEKRVRDLIKLAAAQGQLVRIADGLWLHESRWEEMTGRVSAAIRERGPVTVAEIRTLLGSSRKFVVPIVEYLDATGVTRRQGDRRTLGPNAPAGRT